MLNRLGLARFDPWLSYGILIGIAVLVMKFFEKPMQRIIRERYIKSYGR